MDRYRASDLYTCVCMYMYVCMYVYVYACMYMHQQRESGGRGRHTRGGSDFLRQLFLRQSSSPGLTWRDKGLSAPGVRLRLDIGLSRYEDLYIYIYICVSMRTDM